MMHKAVEVILLEHQALAAMLRSISMLIAQHRAERSAPDFQAFRAMLFYLDEFPEKRHHKKESELLFPKLRARAPQHRVLLDQLDSEHRVGEARIRELEHALLGFEMMGEARRAQFEECAHRFVDFYLPHMRVEEKELLPLAQQHLTAADWEDLDAAFLLNHDRLAGAEPETAYESLFTRIVHLVPAPVGLGPRSAH